MVMELARWPAPSVTESGMEPGPPHLQLPRARASPPAAPLGSDLLTWGSPGRGGGRPPHLRLPGVRRAVAAAPGQPCLGSALLWRPRRLRRAPACSLVSSPVLPGLCSRQGPGKRTGGKCRCAPRGLTHFGGEYQRSRPFPESGRSRGAGHVRAAGVRASHGGALAVPAHVAPAAVRGTRKRLSGVRR